MRQKPDDLLTLLQHARRGWRIFLALSQRKDRLVIAGRDTREVDRLLATVDAELSGWEARIARLEEAT